MSWKAMLHILAPMINQTCLATNLGVAGCQKLLQKVEISFLFFIFLNWKPNSFCWYFFEDKSFFQQIEAVCHSREAVLLWVFLPIKYFCWITIESFWIIHVNLQLSQKFQLPNRATWIWNLVAPDETFSCLGQARSRWCQVLIMPSPSNSKNNLLTSAFIYRNLLIASVVCHSFGPLLYHADSTVQFFWTEPFKSWHCMTL